MANCFSCKDVRKECVDTRRYVPYSDNDTCIYRAIANTDEARRKLGDFGNIKLKQMYAEYLSSLGKKQEALEVLSSE